MKEALVQRTSSSSLRRTALATTLARLLGVELFIRQSLCLLRSRLLLLELPALVLPFLDERVCAVRLWDPGRFPGSASVGIYPSTGT
jgi:hypothetical protein